MIPQPPYLLAALVFKSFSLTFYLYMKQSSLTFCLQRDEKKRKYMLRSCQIYPLSFLREEHGVTWGGVTLETTTNSVHSAPPSRNPI